MAKINRCAEYCPKLNDLVVRSSVKYRKTRVMRLGMKSVIEMEVLLRDHMYLCTLLFSLCTAVFDSRLFTSDLLRAPFCVIKSSAKVKKNYRLSNPYNSKAILTMASVKKLRQDAR